VSGATARMLVYFSVCPKAASAASPPATCGAARSFAPPQAALARTAHALKNDG
jgi:hypothetical protein